MAKQENVLGKEKLKVPEKLPEHKIKKQKETTVYKTEDQLKEEARLRMEEQRLIQSQLKPKSEREKKVENFFFHYKGALIASAIAIVIAAFFLKDIVFSVKPDFTITMISLKYVSGEAQEQFTKYMETLAPDTNRDGKVKVNIDYIQLPSSYADPRFLPQKPKPAEGSENLPVTQGDPEMEYANIMKLMAILSANSDQIFLLDDAAFDYLKRMNAEKDENGRIINEGLDGLFMQMQEDGASNIYALPVSGTNIPLDEGDLSQFANISFYVRDWSENTKKSSDVAYTEELIQALTK